MTIHETCRTYTCYVFASETDLFNTFIIHKSFFTDCQHISWYRYDSIIRRFNDNEAFTMSFSVYRTDRGGDGY